MKLLGLFFIWILLLTPIAVPTGENLPPGAVIEDVSPPIEALTFFEQAPDGRIFLIQKTGEVRVIISGTLQPNPVITFDVDRVGEKGLTGIALDPDFNNNHYIYVKYNPNTGLSTTDNSVYKFVEENNIGLPETLELIFRSRQGERFHTGGDISFGPDGKLYVPVGDDFTSPYAQDFQFRQGKIHRINTDGSIPFDNPYVNDPNVIYPSIYARGVRNPQEVVFGLGTSYFSENGPACDDEMNRLESAYNYGWNDIYNCNEFGIDPTYNTISPLWTLPTEPCCVAPTGMEFYNSPRIYEWQNSLFMCSYLDAKLRHFYLSPNGYDIVSETFVNGVPCNLDVATGIDGSLYFVNGGGYGPGTLKRITTVDANPICEIEFYDVGPGHTYNRPIYCLACNNIITGYSDHTFRPNLFASRGQLAKIVSNSAGFIEPVSGQTFADVGVTHTFYEYIERMGNRGIVDGYPCGGVNEPCDELSRPYFRSAENVSRGQSAKIVSNTKGYDEVVTVQSFEDVVIGSTFYTYTERLVLHNLVHGYPCGGVNEPCISGKPYFRPSSYITRGQLSQIVGLAYFEECVGEINGGK